MRDPFEKDLRDHLHREAAQAKDLPSALPGRIRKGLDSGGRLTPIQQLALVVAMLIFIAAVGFLVVQLKGSRGSLPAQSGFACANRSGGDQNASSSLRIVRVSPEGGFDRVTFEFDGPVPAYRVDQVDSMAPAEGGGFLHISLRNISSPASGIVTSVDPAPRLVTETRELTAPAEWTVFGISLANPTCNRVSELLNPTRLVIDFLTPAAFTCNTVAGGEQGSGPGTLTGIAVQPGGNSNTGFYDHLAFSFDSAVPPYSVIPGNSATFSRYDGTTVTLLGSTGVRLKLGNVRNTDLSKISWSMASSGPSPTKTSPTDFTPNLLMVKEVAVLDNSQGTIQFGIGLASPACIRVIDQGKSLVIDFQSPAPVAQVPIQVRELSFPDALHGWALGAASKGQTTYLILARTTDGGATWQYQPFQDQAIARAAGDTWHIFFENATTGWLYGPHLYVTRDGGRSWALTPQPGPVAIGLGPLLALAASDDSVWTVTAVMECTAPTGSCPPTLLVSTDGGRNWTVAPQQPIVGRLAQIVRNNHDLGWILSWRHYALGDSSSLAVTHDGGATWQTVPTPCAPAMSFEDRIAAIDDRNIWIVCGSQPGAGSQQKQLVTSTDGGFHWSQPPNPPSTGYVSGLALSGPTSGLTGWLATARGPLYLTTDGGRTWQAADARGVLADLAGSGALEVVFSDPLHGWAATSSEIFRTADGGLHWTGVPAEALE